MVSARAASTADTAARKGGAPAPSVPVRGLSRSGGSDSAFGKEGAAEADGLGDGRTFGASRQVAAKLVEGCPAGDDVADVEHLETGGPHRPVERVDVVEAPDVERLPERGEWEPGLGGVAQAVGGQDQLPTRLEDPMEGTKDAGGVVHVLQDAVTADDGAGLGHQRSLLTDPAPDVHDDQAAEPGGQSATHAQVLDTLVRRPQPGGPQYVRHADTTTPRRSPPGPQRT